MAAEGYRRLLGRPALELLPTMLRESIQNVLDASEGPDGATVLIRLRTLTTAEAKALREHVFAELPLGDDTRADMEASLGKERLRVLEVCDFGTQGLSGPTGADAPHDGEEPLNFVNFLRNVGAARDTHFGGGTYGYGKSSLYAMSACSTILVDTHTTSSGQTARRLMACHLGAAFDAAVDGGTRRRYTGRHWWGIRDGHDSIEPSVGSDASELSLSLGMPERVGPQFGTTIMMIDPVLGDESARSSADDIVESVLWNFWPRMTATTAASRKLKVRVELEGESVPVPEPEAFPPLDLFAAAIAEHHAGSQHLEEIRCGNPNKLLGHFARRNGLRAERRGPAIREGSIIPKQASHIALMRPVELVVRYIEGEALPDRRFDWAGVFICSDESEVEEAFALAEPPAHDDWIPDNLPKGRAKTYVRVALRELNRIARPPVQAPSPAGGEEAQTPSLAAVAARMGQFLGEVSATGPGRRGSASGSSSRRRSLAISTPRFVGLELDGAGRPMTRFRAELSNDGSDDDLHLIAEPYLVADGGATGNSDLPTGFDIRVASMQLGDLIATGPALRAGEASGTVDVLVSTVDGAALGLKIRLQGGRAA